MAKRVKKKTAPATTIEEPPSANDDLITLNEQLQNRNAELARLADDLTKVLDGVNIPILILGENRRIRRFTPSAGKLLRLVPGDIGRPIGDLHIGISIPDMETVIATVMDKGIEIRREVQADEDHRWYMLSVRPFRTGEREIEGVLVAFVDVDHLKREQDALRRERDINSSILDAAQDLLIVVVDSQGKIVHLNGVAERVLGYSLNELKGKDYEILVPMGDRPRAREQFVALLGGASLQLEGEIVTKAGRRVLISWSSGLASSDRNVPYVIATGIDVTEKREMERQASESAATVRTLLETAAQAILAVDQRGRIVLINDAAEKMYGYSHSELIGQPLSRLVPAALSEGHASSMSAWFRDPARRPMGQGMDLQGLRKDGTEFPVEVSLSSVETRGGMLGVAFISDISLRRKSEAAMQAYRNQLQQLTTSLISSQENGNRELARELHDVFSQELAAASMEVSALLASTDAGSPFAERLSSLGKKIARLAEEIHDTSRRLHPAILDDLGLEAGLREECHSFQHQSGIPADFTSEDLPAKIPKAAALCLYRVAQESLRNIRKHSRATQVDVSLRGTSDQGEPASIVLTVANEGDGFDLDRALRKGGLGIISMEERVRSMGGQLKIESQPDQGTTVTASVPLHPKAS